MKKKIPVRDGVCLHVDLIYFVASKAKYFTTLARAPLSENSTDFLNNRVVRGYAANMPSGFTPNSYLSSNKSSLEQVLQPIVNSPPNTLRKLSYLTVPSSKTAKGNNNYPVSRRRC